MTALQDDFDFYSVGTGDRPFTGYDSSSDPTTVVPTSMVGGSKNVYKDDNGNITVRPGLKRFGPQDPSLNAVVSSYEWQTSFGEVRTIRVLADGKFQVYEGGMWILIDTFTKSRFVFTPWWADAIQQSLLVMANGTTSLFSWSGGVITAIGGINTAGVEATGNTVTTAMSMSVLTDSTDRLKTSSNTQVGSAAKAGIVLATNPSNGDTFNYTVANTAPTKSANVTIEFLTTLPATPQATSAYILIGASKEESAANLLGFLNSPNTSTATRVAITDADTISGIQSETYALVNSLETGDGAKWSTYGFTNGYPTTRGTIVVDGVDYTYDLVADQFLINISGVPTTGEPAVQGIYESTNTPSADFTVDFVATITNQIIAGSYTSLVVYFSSDADYTDYTNSGDIISGDPDNIVLDELPRGIIVVDDKAYIPAGSSSWYICAPNTPVPIQQPLTGGNDRLVIVSVQKKVGASKTAALAQEFLGAIADTIIYLGQDHQLRMFGVFKDILGTKFPSISISVKQELIETDFTGGQLRAVGDNIYLVAPVPGKTFIYQQRDDVNADGSIVSQRIWQPPQDWNISRIAVIDDVEYGYSNQSPETYQLWNTGQWHDDTPSGDTPYEAVMRMGYWQFKDRTKKGDLNKVFLEGYMPQNIELTCTLRADYLGATAIEDDIVSADGDSPVLYTTDGVLVGDKLVGQALYGGASGVTGIPKFRCIPNFKKHQCFEYQVELSSFALDSRWEIISIGTNGSQVINKPVELLKG